MDAAPGARNWRAQQNTALERTMSFFQNVLDKRSLLGRLSRGGAWVAVGNIGEQGLRLVRNMILARLLAPKAFGLMAMVLSFGSVLQVLTAVGVREAIIQNPKSAERTFINGAWWLAAIRSVLLYLAGFVAAPWLAEFYHRPQLCVLARVAFLNVVFQGLLSPGVYVLLKQMRYARWVLVQQGGGLIGVTVTLILAMHIKGVWALAIGYVTEGLAECVLSYCVSPFRPSFQFHREQLNSLLSYSRGIFGLPALMLIYAEGATFMVGKMCPTEQLGMYAMALGLARVPRFVAGMAGELMIPAFSEIQDERARVNRALLKITAFMVVFSAPVLPFVMLFGREILGVLYGSVYSKVATPFALLVANEMLFAFNSPFAAVCLASGKPAMLRRFSFFRAVLLVALIYPAIRVFGLSGAAATVLLAMGIATGLMLDGIRRLTNLDLKRLLLLVLVGVPLAVPTIVVWASIRLVAEHMSPVAVMIVVGFVTAAVYSVLAVLVLRSPQVKTYFWPGAAMERP
jgi:O-antigen/teichoic acid export membrane protein